MKMKMKKKDYEERLWGGGFEDILHVKHPALLGAEAFALHAKTGGHGCVDEELELIARPGPVGNVGSACPPRRRGQTP